jgi:electron transport complex protein RnfC
MRRVHDFHGGMFPPERKTLSNRASYAAPPSRNAIVPLSQHIGRSRSLSCARRQGACRPAPDRSQRTAGTRLEFGHVAAIEDQPLPHASGMSGPCIVIDCDGEDRWIDLEPLADYRNADTETLIQHLFAAGIAGLGGAGFPTAWKLPHAGGKNIDTLMINGTECEPYITADDLLMRERAAEIIAGIDDPGAHLRAPGDSLWCRGQQARSHCQPAHALQGRPQILS